MRSNLAVAFIVIVILGGASTILTANTVEGAGQNVSKASHEISESARK